MKNKQYKLDIIPGIVLAVFSIAYLSMIPGIQTFTGLGATPLTNHFVPYLWGGVLLVLSLWIIARGFRKRKKYLAEGGKIEKTSLKAGLMEKREAEALYTAFGTAYAKTEHWRLYLLSSHTEFERAFGRPADKKRKLYNGTLRCDLFQYTKDV